MNASTPPEKTKRRPKTTAAAAAFWQGWGRDVAETWRTHNFQIGGKALALAWLIMTALQVFAGWSNLPDRLFLFYGANIAGGLTVVLLLGETRQRRKERTERE